MARLLWRRPRRVLVDVDTQIDLLATDAAEAAVVLRNIRRLMAWARRNRALIISTMLSLRDNAAHRCLCREGAPGHAKLGHTLIASRLWFPPDNCTDLPRHLLSQYQQVIFEKRTIDPFEQPRAERLLTEMRADEFVIFGASTEQSIKFTVLGLLHRKKPVSVVTDAIIGHNRHEAALALRQIEAKGAVLTTTESIAGHSRLVGAPRLYGVPELSHRHG